MTNKTIEDILESWLDSAMSTSTMGWSTVDGYKGNEENSELEAGKDYDKYLLKATQAITQAMLDVLPEKDTFVKDEGAGSRQFNDYTNGRNHAISEIRTAIKKRGSDE